MSKEETDLIDLPNGLACGKPAIYRDSVQCKGMGPRVRLSNDEIHEVGAALVTELLRQADDQ